jgi:sulfoxide reductase heme-binding subunit YedZ
MSVNSLSKQRNRQNRKNLPYGWIALTLLILGAVVVADVFFTTQLQDLRNLTYSLLATNSVQLYWYITRAAGITAYLLLWFSTVWGLVIPTKILDDWLGRNFTFDFHQFISLLSLGFLALHVIVLMFDRYLPYSLSQILVPFLSPYRPVWVGIGVIAFYLSVLVTVTFYFRQRIGMTAFRTIHYTSLLAYLGSTAHGIFAGTDSSMPMAMFMYVGSFLVVFFLTAFWLLTFHRSKDPLSK